MSANYNECQAAGIDPKKVDSLIRSLNKTVKKLDELDITLFGGSGSGTLRYRDTPHKGALIVGELLGSNFDGGDGAYCENDDNLLRGEYD